MNDHIVVAPLFGLRLLVAGLLGAAIGMERQWRQRGAGLHTSALVAIGAALFALLSPVVGAESETRVLANIVTGVGFLAGGVILRQGANVSGLNTAATIWATAAVGALAGIGLFEEAAMGAVAILGFNLLLQPVVSLIDGRAILYRERHRAKSYRLRVRCTEESEPDVRAAIVEQMEREKFLVQALSTAPGDSGEEIRAEVHLRAHDDDALNRVATALSQRKDVREVRWQNVDSD